MFINYLLVGQYEKSIAVSDEVQDASTTDVVDEKEEEIPFLLRYPSQCVRCVEAVVWSNKVCHALACEDKNDLKALWFVMLSISNTMFSIVM